MTPSAEHEAPILEFDSAPTAVIEPAMIYDPVPDMPTMAVMSWMRDAVQRCYSEYAATEVGRFTAETLDIPICRVEVDDTAIVLVEAPVGAPVSVGVLEMMIAMGVRSVVAVGSSGGLTPQHSRGTVVVPDGAIRDEGTSYHYVHPSQRVAHQDAAMQAWLVSALSAADFSTATGLLWTTDALFRETRKRVADRVDEGALAVDMEASALAAVAKFRDIEIGQAVYIADTLFGDEWDGDGLINPDADFRYRLLTTVLRAAASRHA